MDTEIKELHAAVRHGFQILLRAEAFLCLPTDRECMRAFYTSLGESCMQWAVEVHGARLTKEFEALESVREKSAFSMSCYKLETRLWDLKGPYCAVLCESKLSGLWHEPQKSYYRSAQVWDCREQVILPMQEVLQRFGFAAHKRALPFRPDGAYPEGDEMVFFRNATEHEPFSEQRLPRNT